VRSRWIAAALVFAALTALGLQTSVVVRTGFLMGDFRAFYCAARVAAHGADPYRTEPLRSCETAVGTTLFFEKNPGVTIPAPLPGYVIAALVPLAVLPFAVAATLWSVLLLLAWLACIVALSRFARISWEISLAVFALSLGAISLPFGEVVPLSLGCICLAAYFAWQGRDRAAAIAAAGAMIEPHLGLPVCAALAVCRPATRLPLAIGLGALGAISLAALGPATNLEYFASVLPAHALSEMNRDTQYSFTAVLAALGTSQTAALRGGFLWYVAMLAAGTLVAGILAKQTRNGAFVVCVPPAFAVFGGTFIHVTQIAAALPAAVLLVAYSSRAYRTLAIVALLALAVPWGWVISPAMIVVPLVPVGYLAWRYWTPNRAAILLAGIGCAVISLALLELMTATPHTATHVLAPAIDPRLAEASWSLFTAKGSTNALASWMLRLPTWAALALLLSLLARQAAATRLSLTRMPAIAVAAICTLVPFGAQFYGDYAGGRLAVDARAYYCAALAQRHHENPYFARSLHECERNARAPYYRPPPNVTVPAPYPPYVLALLYPLTLLPFGAAVVAWWLLLGIALALAAYALARVAQQPLLVAWAAIALSAGLMSLSPGNMMPLALALLVVAALFAARERFIVAAAATTLAMIEPHIALPAAIALFVAIPSIRFPLAIGGALLASLSVASGGVTQTISYFTAVLPAHALAEVSRDNQYSLSSVLTSLGVPDASAALLGGVSYLVMTSLGVLVALRLARRYADPAMVVLVPPAFALLGGSFVHTNEIAAAVPACLLLFTRAQAYRSCIFAALVLLAVPWMAATSATLFLAPAFPVAYLTYVLGRRDRTMALAAAVASFAAILALFELASTPGGHAVTAYLRPAIDPRLAEASWRTFVLGDVTNRSIMWLLRLPTWAGLVALIASAALLARKTPHLVAVGEYRLSESRA
jgi:Glycosyltransferase family 87